MGIITENILIYSPNKVDDNVYFSKIMDGLSEITFQIPKTKIHFDKEKDKCKILIDEKTFSELKDISEDVIRLTSENSKNFFGKELDVESCSSLYRNAITSENLLNCFYTDDTYFFDSKGQLDILDINDEITGIALLKGDVVVYTKTAFYIRWEIQQMKIKREKKEHKNLLNEYSIIDIKEDDSPSENEKISKKIKELTFF
jgi:hypothetical protein